LFVSTSRSEGCPNVVLEAMRAAKPIVMTNSCDTRGFIREGENGYVVGLDDLENMVHKIRDLLSSDQMRKKFGHKSLEIVVKNFSSVNAAWILAEIYLSEFKGISRIN
jgi:glycosyltransferase EpsD